MRKTFLLLGILIFVGILSCQKGNKSIDSTNEDLLMLTKLGPDSLLEDILSMYTENVQCAGCINEIYIDVIEPHKTIFTIKTIVANKSRYIDRAPLIYTKYNNKIFFIYSGVEKYFRYEINADSILNANECINDTWVYIDSFGVLKELHTYATPFMPLPINKNNTRYVPNEYFKKDTI